jgi:hypothetical protein
LCEEINRIVKRVGNSELFSDKKTNSTFVGGEVDLNGIEVREFVFRTIMLNLSKRECSDKNVSES